MSYKSRISASKDEKAAAQVELEVIEAKASVEGVIAAEKLKQAKLKGAKEALLSRAPLDIEKVLSIQLDLDASVARQSAAASILEAEFAD